MQEVSLRIWGAKMHECLVVSSLCPPWEARTLCVLCLASSGFFLPLSLLGPLGLPWMLQSSLPNSTTWFKPVSSGGPGPSPSHLHFLPSRMLSSVVPGPSGHSRPQALSAAPQGSLAAGLPQPPGWQRLSQVSPAPHSAETAAAAAAATTPTPSSQPAAAAALSSLQDPEGVTCNRRCPHRTSQRPPACHLITHSSISNGQQQPSPALCSRCPPGAQRAHRGAASACTPSLWLLHLLWRRCSAQAFLLGLHPHLPRFRSLAGGALGLSSLYTHCQERVYPNPLVSSSTVGDPDFWVRPVPLPVPRLVPCLCFLFS